MPCKEGVWQYETQCNADELNGVTGEFTCVEAAPGEHGPVRVHNKFHFAHDDGTPFYPVGTTAYAWTHQQPEIVEQTLKTLKESPFNKIRMCVFPKHYLYNLNEPPLYPYEGGLIRRKSTCGMLRRRLRVLRTPTTNSTSLASTPNFGGISKVVSPSCETWASRRILSSSIRMTDRFSRMDEPAIQLYLRYLVARIGAFSNVWWSMANEYDLFRTKTEQDWERWAYTVVEWDASEHLRSIHNCNSFYDHSKGWITHASIQRIDYHSHVELVAKWRERWQKPVVVDEIRYEGV